jgi:O-antigen ligase
MRQLSIFTIGLFTLIGSVVATLGTSHLRDFETRGYVDPTLDQNLPFTSARLGVNVELEQYSEEALNINLQLMQDSNFVWLRQFVYWDEIEPLKGEYNWDTWDRITEAINNYPDLELVVVLMNTPQWARVNPPQQKVSHTAPPQSPKMLAGFVHTFALRYGDIIDYYQVWDEPNLDDAWGLLNPNPTDYVALLSEAYTAIHNADPSATVISAALAPTTEKSGQNISDIRYLQAMYQWGAKDVMDVVSGKPYGFSDSPLERTVDETILNFSRIIALREVMVANNDGKTPLWASHWGWNSLPENWQGEASVWGQVTEEEQVKYTLQALDRTHRELPWLGVMMLHQWKPDAKDTNPQWGFSLISQDNEPTPLLKAIQNYDLPDLPQNGLFHPRTLSARYSGVWEFSNLGADIGWLETTDSQLEFDFTGTDITILLREDDYVAFLYPTVDGQQVNATARDTDGNAYIFLRSNSRTQETNLVPIATRLSNDKHTLEIIADKGWDQWAIAGFAVSSGNLATPYDNQITIGAFAILISLILVFVSAINTPWRELMPATTVLFQGVSVTSHLIFSGVTSIAMMIAMLLTWSSHRPNILIRDEINLILAVLTGGMLYLSPSIIITVIAGIALLVLFYHRLETGLVLTLFFAPFFLFPIELYNFAFPMAEVMILITTGAWLLKLMVNWGIDLQMQNSAYPIFGVSRLKQHLTTIDLCVIGIVIAAFVSLLWTQYLDVAITELRTFIIEPILFYLILRTIKPTKETLLSLVDTLILSAVLISIIGLFQYAQGEGIITAEAGAKRLASIYGSPNNVGLLLGRAMPFALAFLLINLGKKRRIFAGVSLIIMGITLALTQSVGAILMGVPTSAIVMLLAIYQRKSVTPILGVGVIGSIGFVILSQISARFANLLDFTSGTNFFRLRVWDSAFEIIQDYPITGIGLDQFLYLFSGEYIRPDAIWDRDLSHPHNFILDFWTRLGIIGVILFIIIQISFWKQAISIIQKARQYDKLIFALTVGLMGSMADLLAHGLIDNSVFVYDLAFIFMFQLSLMVSLTNICLIDEA